MSAESVALRTGTATGRWVIAASVLGSGVAFLDGTVVNAALPSIAKDLGADLAAVQWVVTAYLLTLGSLLVLGGSLGDLFGRRRVFVLGLVGFGVASLLCGISPTSGFLIAARAAQGAAAALLVPGSLAIIAASFHPIDRARAIGAWAGLAGVSSAAGPFLGGWLIDSVSWRAVFFVNLPFIVVTVWITLRHVPETRDEHAVRHVDVVGGALLAVGLAGVVYGLIEGPSGWSAVSVTLLVGGVACLAAFLLVESRSPYPMVPLGVFRSRQFSGANLVTFAVYAALGVTMFLVVVHVQTDLGYSALEAGATMLPLTIVMLLFSARAGALAQRIGPRIPMTVGPLITAAGIALLTRIEPGVSYWSGVFPGTVVIAVGMTLTVAPLTATVLGAVEDAHAGVASAINNAVARIAGLVMIAVVPALAGLSGTGDALDLDAGFGRAMVIAAVTCAAGGVIAWFTIRRAAVVVPSVRGELSLPCDPPCVVDAAA